MIFFLYKMMFWWIPSKPEYVYMLGKIESNHRLWRKKRKEVVHVIVIGVVSEAVFPVFMYTDRCSCGEIESSERRKQEANGNANSDVWELQRFEKPCDGVYQQEPREGISFIKKKEGREQQ